MRAPPGARRGLRTVRAELGRYWPTGLRGIRGLIASPPCPAFSAAGSRSGVPDLTVLVKMLDSEAVGTWDDWAPHQALVDGGLTLDGMLLAEPARWIDRWAPLWIAFEQVPPVLPVWQALARWLERRGYSTWAGVLNAADFGVPQTRQRAFLMAHRDGRVVMPPAATHDRTPTPTLFGDELVPWVSMAEALGLGGVETLDRREHTDWTSPMSVSRPAPTVTASAVDRNWVLHTNRGQEPDGSRQTRTLDRPAPAFTAKSIDQWVLNPGLAGWKDQDHHGRRRPLTEPAPSLAFGKDFASWCWERPATTIAGDSRCWPPGHKINQADIDRLGEDEAKARYGDRAGTEAVRLTVEQAAALQSFPPDWPWQGSKTSKAQQVGNAVPVLLARAVLEALQ